MGGDLFIRYMYRYPLRDLVPCLEIVGVPDILPNM